MKLAYFSPLPPQRTGVADYSRELLPELAARAEVDLWVDTPAARETLPDCRMFNYDGALPPRVLGGYDAAIYHIGNSSAHRGIYRMLLQAPGVVVMHDFVLHHFFAAYYLEAQRSPAAYIEEMAYNYGAAGEELARQALRGGRPIWEDDPLRYPLNHRVLDHARGVIVHSEFTRGLIRQSHPHLPVLRVNLPVTVATPSGDCAELRRRYGIPADKVVIGSLGFGSAAKRIGMVLRAIGELDRGDIIYLVVGELGEALRRDLRRGGDDRLVHATGYVGWEAFNDYCHLIDIGVDLRYPTMGESSASVCRIMGAGKPCVVSNVGWFAEIPDGCAIKLSPAPAEDALAQCLSDLLADAPLRRRIGANARKYIVENHNPAHAAAAYVAFVEELQAIERGSSVRTALTRTAGRAMAEIGVSAADNHLVDAIAERIASLFGFSR